MKRLAGRIVRFALCTLAAAAFLPSGAFGAASFAGVRLPATLPRPSSVIVAYASAGDAARVRAAVVATGGTIEKTYRWNAFLVSVPKWSDSIAFSKAAKRIRGVRYAQGDSTVYALGTANDPLFPQQWGLFDIHATDAWDASEGSGIAIAEIDTGVDYTHSDLSANVQSFYDYVNNDADAMDDSASGHGTHVAGILAAARNNGIFGAGTAPRARVYAFKVLDATGEGSVANVVTAIHDAVDKTPCRIITMSLGQPASDGTPDENAAMTEAVAYARSHGVLVVAAAGNSSSSAAFYPAALPGVIGVGSVGPTNVRSAFSDYGPDDVDLAAPGEAVTSTLPGNRAGAMMGTSMATPFVSASAALLWSARPSLDATGVESLLELTAQDLGTPGYDVFTGYGLVRPDLAIAALPPLAPSLTIGSSPSSTRLPKPFVLSGVAAPAAVGQPVVAWVKKPGSARWSYSSARLAYALDGSGGALWWYRYTPRLRGVYSFYATSAVPGASGPVQSRTIKVTVS